MQKEIIKTSVFGTRVSLGHITLMYCDSAWQWPPLVSKVYHLTGMPLSKKVFFSASFNRALLPSSCSTPPVSDSALSWANTRSAPWVDLSEEGKTTSVQVQSWSPAKTSHQEVTLSCSSPLCHTRHCWEHLQTEFIPSSHDRTITSCSQRQGTGISKPNQLSYQTIINSLLFISLPPLPNYCTKAIQDMTSVTQDCLWGGTIWDPNPGEDLRDGQTLQGQTLTPATAPGPSWDPYHMAAWIIVWPAKAWPDTILIQVCTEGRRKKIVFSDLRGAWVVFG